MADDPNKTAQDRHRINVNQDFECRYWSEKYGISPEKLQEVVKKVGPMVEDVETELGYQS
jgi:hypothetical protein